VPRLTKEGKLKVELIPEADGKYVRFGLGVGSSSYSSEDFVGHGNLSHHRLIWKEFKIWADIKLCSYAEFVEEQPASQ
jgi:hypothetical protein